MTILVLIISLFCYTKSVLIGPVLAYVLIAYFAEGDLRRRVVICLRRYWAAAVLGGAVTAAYVVYYVTQVPQPFENPDRGQFADVIETVLGSSFPTSLLGGPWRWWDTTPPVVLASPPDWAVSLSWVLIAGIVAYSVLTRSRVVAGWILLFAYATGLGLLLASSRGQLLRPALRARVPLPDRRHLRGDLLHWASSSCRSWVRRRQQTSRAAPAARRAAPGRRHRHRGGDQHRRCAEHGPLRELLAHEQCQQGVRAQPAARPRGDTATSTGRRGDAGGRHARLHNSGEHDRSLHPAARGGDVVPQVTDMLQLIDDHGNLSEAAIRTGVTSRPGPVANCGWKVGTAGRTIPLTGSTFDYGWWLRIGYLASSDSPVTVTAGDAEVRGSMQDPWIAQPVPARRRRVRRGHHQRPDAWDARVRGYDRGRIP